MHMFKLLFKDKTNKQSITNINEQKKRFYYVSVTRLEGSKNSSLGLICQTNLELVDN